MGEVSRKRWIGERHGGWRWSRREFLVAAGATAVAACSQREARVNGAWLSWGGSGARDGEFRRPRAIAATESEVFVIDTSGRMQVFSQGGGFRRGWIMPEYENGTPTAITFSAEGTLLIPDTHYSRILEYTPEGEFVRQWGEYGAGEDEFIYPTDIVQTPDGGFVISEYGQGAERVHVFDRDRRFLRQWGRHGDGPGEFSRAMSIAYRDETVIVCDTANHRIQCFLETGGLLRVFGESGTGQGQLKFPHDIAVTPDGKLLIAEYGNNRLSLFTIAGDCVATFGRAGRGPGEFAAPRGVAIGPNGFVFVADTDNDRVQRFRLEDIA